MTTPFRPAARTLLFAATLAAGAATLSGCIPAVLGGAAAGTAVVATDRRNSSSQLDDQNIQFKVEAAEKKKFGDSVRINANSYEGQVLLVGDVPTQAIKDEASAVAQSQEKVKSVVNQLTVGPILSLSARSNDTWISSKVRTALLNERFVPSGSISVTVDHAVVYLQGKVTATEGEYAANAVAGVGGVAKVVKLFQTISRDEAVRSSGSNSPPPDANVGKSGSVPIEDNSAGGADSGASNSGNGVQAIPIK
jgi:osmotically-inducible protein OsmY